MGALPPFIRPFTLLIILTFFFNLQIICTSTHNVSFVQVRGSVPVYWSQPGYKYRPPPRLDRGRQSRIRSIYFAAQKLPHLIILAYYARTKSLAVIIYFFSSEMPINLVSVLQICTNGQAFYCISVVLFSEQLNCKYFQLVKQEILQQHLLTAQRIYIHMQIISFVLVLIEATGIACVKFCVIRLSTDEEETRWAFRKHFDHQLELYKTVVSIKYYIYLILIKRHDCNYMYMYNGIFKFQGLTCFFDLHTCNKLVKYFMIKLYQYKIEEGKFSCNLEVPSSMLSHNGWSYPFVRASCTGQHFDSCLSVCLSVCLFVIFVVIVSTRL